jgi:DUF971 family protein
MVPIKIERRTPELMVLTYPGDKVIEVPSILLRKNCPCAMCREERGDGASHAAPLTAGASAPKKSLSLKVIEHSVDQQIRIEQLWGIGNYALGIRWGDGHDDGIFAWPYLYDLATQLEKVRS